MKQPKRHLITAALPYANGPLHIGHLAGAYLPADIYARFLRLKKEDVAFVCGSDEHGAAITLRAKREGVEPQEIVDTYHEMNKKAFADFGVSFDIYDRTSSEVHHQMASDFFLELEQKGSFEIQESEQYFDEDHQQFLADRYIMGTCPKCGNDKAYGDQCEKCGTSLSPKELIDPLSTLSGQKPKLKRTKHWYLPMQKHEEWLKNWLANGQLDGQQHHDPKSWRKPVLGQCMSWLDGGLASRAMTRDLNWGVKVPVEGADGKVLYVWLDAPIGYISATKKWAEENNKDYRDYWQNEESHLTHFIGKDNIVFHCIIFPIILKEHGGYNLPVNVPANEFLNLEGDKLSTSRNWAVWLHEYMEDLPNKEDELRYVLTSIAPEAKDSEFTWADYQARVNNELVAILGNFVNRAMVLSHKYFDGVVRPAKLTENDSALLKEVSQIPDNVNSMVAAHKYRDALTEAMKLARMGNKYLADTEPWKVFKTDPERVKTILNVSIQIMANLGIVLEPFLPRTAEKMRTMLGMPDADWSSAGGEIITPGTQLEKPSLLFQKVEDELIQKQVQKLEASKLAQQEKNHEPQKEEASFDDFMKMDIRTGVILSAEKVKKANKLLKLEVDTGLDQRTIVSGIAEHYSAEEVVGKTVSVLLNLAPRKIRGVESQGMILMAESKSGELKFITPEDDIPVGSEIR